MRSVVVAAVLAAMAGPALADNSPLEQCAVQWRDLTAAGKTVGLDYRLFAARCLKANATAPTADLAAPPKASMSGQRKATAKTRRPNRMSVCAAQWRQMKAQNTTNGLTYRQWSSQCLRKKS